MLCCASPQHLKALCFLEAGRTYVPAKPWLPQEESRWACSAHDLPQAVRQLVQRFGSASSSQGAAAGVEAAA